MHHFAIYVLVTDQEGQMKKGTFCISLDTELLWGRHDRDWHKFIWRAKKVRSIVNKLLLLFDKYKIPATWAIVGKLYEKPKKQKYADLWRTPDIIKLITKYKIHEIGSHSYSHPEFDKLNSREAEEEIKKCLKSASFIFPRNKIAHLNVLKNYGFKCYRGSEYSESKLKELTRLFLGFPQIASVSKNGGLVNIPSTMYFVSRRGYRKYLPVFLRVRLAKRGIDKAIAERKLFHLWFHPIDLADETEKMLEGLQEILKYAKQKRNEGLLEVKTMGEIALEFGKK